MSSFAVWKKPAMTEIRKAKAFDAKGAKVKASFAKKALRQPK
jgi:hypothetical protein